jgi:hypothetical protein
VEKDPSVHIEVADGHLVDILSRGEVLLYLTDTYGDPFTTRLNTVLYAPGLAQRIFSVNQFSHTNNTAQIVKNSIDITFSDRTVPLLSATRVAFNNAIAQKKTVTQAPGTKLETSGLSHWKPFTTTLVTDAELPSCLPQDPEFGMPP